MSNHVLTRISLVNFSPFGLDSLNYTNKDILYADFDVNNDGMPQEYNNLTKPASIPSVNGGILWEDKVNKVGNTTVWDNNTVRADGCNRCCTSTGVNIIKALQTASQTGPTI